MRKSFLATIGKGGEQKVELAAGRAGQRQLQNQSGDAPGIELRKGTVTEKEVSFRNVPIYKSH